MRAAFVAAWVALGASTAAGESVDMSGFYAGAMVSRSTGWEFNEWSKPWTARPPIYYWPPSTRSEQDMDWWSGSLLAGYNWMNGTGLIGLEARISTGLSTADASISERRIFPDSMYFGSYGMVGVDRSRIIRQDRLELNQPHAMLVDLTSEYSVREVASPDLSIRFGRQFDKMLLYIKLGGGVSWVEETRVIDDTSSVYCTSRVFYSTLYEAAWFAREDSASPCLASTGGTYTSKTSTRVMPAVLAGVGAEYHWEKMFVRGEAELRAVIDNELDFQPASSTSSYVRFGLGVGYKF